MLTVVIIELANAVCTFFWTKLLHWESWYLQLSSHVYGICGILSCPDEMSSFAESLWQLLFHIHNSGLLMASVIYTF